jgi:ubiquinone/menaquinone biosynthesis C-methylase UbiE
MEITDTGERMIPAFHKGSFIYGEHLARYEAVRELVAGKVVLDIASGSGYGTQILAESAKKVYGVDVSEDSVEYAKHHFGGKNIEFKVGDAVTIPLDDDSVELVVCYETIEHIKDYEQFLREIKRVLQPGGRLILSTPNEDEFHEGNHFHLHEFRLQELKDLLAKHFSHQQWSYEDTWLYSAVISEEHFTDEPTWRLQTMKTVAAAPEQALYFMVVCADEPIEPDQVPAELGVITQRWSAKEQMEIEQDYRRRIQELVDQIPETEEMKSRLNALQKELKETQTHLDGIIYSKSWTVVKALRKLRRIVIFWKP